MKEIEDTVSGLYPISRWRLIMSGLKIKEKFKKSERATDGKEETRRTKKQ